MRIVEEAQRNISDIGQWIRSCPHSRRRLGRASPLGRLSESAGFSGCCPSGREHDPEIDPAQFPILQHHLDRSIRDLGREHPLRSDRDASTGKYSCAHSLRSSDAQPTLQCDRNFRIITLEGPVLASCFLVINHSLVRDEVAGCRRLACPLEIGRGTDNHMPPASDTPGGQAEVENRPMRRATSIPS